MSEPGKQYYDDDHRESAANDEIIHYMQAVQRLTVENERLAGRNKQLERALCRISERKCKACMSHVEADTALDSDGTEYPSNETLRKWAKSSNGPPPAYYTDEGDGDEE